MRFQLDTTAMTFLAAGPPEPVTDYDTKAPRIGEDGKPLYAVSLVALGPDGAQVFSVKTAGEPKGITQGTPVKVANLVATYWELNGRSGVSFRAERIEATTARTAA